jgi:hypothetical protein
VDRYYAIRTMLSPDHRGEDSGLIAVVGSPESEERIGMATQCGPAAGTRPDWKARYMLIVRGQTLEGQWILAGREFRRAE